MKTKSTESITLSNIFAEGINILGVVFSTLLSFLITVACSVSDYTQISILMDSVQHESVFTVVITSLTLCLFLNFSLYIVGTVIKRMACGKPIGGSVIISVISIVLGLLLFAAVFALTFKFKYSLREHIFSVDSVGTVDSIINKAVKSGSTLLNSNIHEEEIIHISAVLSGLLPAFTSILSLLSVLLFYDPLANEKASVRFKLLYYKYKYYITDSKLKAVKREIRNLEHLPTVFRDILAKDYSDYLLHLNEIERAETTIRTAEYTAATELFKKDQDTVTMLSREARTIKPCNRSKPLTQDTVDIPEVLQKQIKKADDLFKEQTTNGERPHSFDNQDTTSPAKGTRAHGDIGNQEDPDPIGNNLNRDDDLMIDQNGNELSVGTSLDRIRSINIPDSMVSPQLKEAANQ